MKYKKIKIRKEKVKTIGKIRIIKDENIAELERKTNEILEELKDHFIQSIELNESGNIILIVHRYIIKENNPEPLVNDS